MSSPLAPGSRVGPYEIVAPLDSGGMATLHLARSKDGLVALKVARAHLSRDAGFVAMFVEEARLGAALMHPNLVRTEAYGQDAGVHYLAMEYVTGVTLGQLLAWVVRTGRGLRPELAVHIAIGTARALHFAHELRDDRGQLLEVVHRDVSPQNVLLGVDGAVKLIDFGVAKAKGRQWATMEGSLKGKLAYMSPEQARAEAIDRRTDVFALGVVLWEALTQRRLFWGADEATLLQRVQSPRIARVRTHVPTLSERLDGVVMNALASAKEERFSTAAELEAALSRACPEALALDRSQLGALVACALEEERDGLPDPVRAALNVPSPGARARTVALQAFTREVAAPPSQREGLGRESVAPETRVRGPISGSMPVPTAPVLLRAVLLGAAALLLLGLSGVGIYWGLSQVRSAEAPSPAAALPAPPIAASGSATAPMVPVTPLASPLPSLPTGSLPTGVAPPPDPVAPATASASRHRDRSRGGARTSPPPPWVEGAPAEVANDTPGRVPLPPPANRPTMPVGRGPVRLPPGAASEAPQ